MLMSSSQFTKQSGGLPTGQVKLPRGSSLPKGSGLGGDSKVRSYPKWIQKEINSVEKGQTWFNSPSGSGGGSSENKVGETSDGEEDEKTEETVPPKSEKEAEEQHIRKFTRKLNNQVARDGGFPEEEDSDNSDVDVEVFHGDNSTITTPSRALSTHGFQGEKGLQTALRLSAWRASGSHRTLQGNPLFRTPRRLFSHLSGRGGGRPSSTFLPDARTRGNLRQPTPSTPLDNYFGSPLTPVAKSFTY